MFNYWLWLLDQKQAVGSLSLFLIHVIATTNTNATNELQTVNVNMWACIKVAPKAANRRPAMVTPARTTSPHVWLHENTNLLHVTMRNVLLVALKSAHESTLTTNHVISYPVFFVPSPPLATAAMVMVAMETRNAAMLV